MKETLPKKIKIKKLCPHAIIPKYQTTKSAGVDLHANLKIDDINLNFICISPSTRRLIKTGIAIQLPTNFEAQIRPRSGLALKHGISIVNSPGTIDSDYIGDIGIILINHGTEPFVVNHGDRIAQMVIAPFIQANFVEEELEHTERGTNGFGSSGIK